MTRTSLSLNGPWQVLFDPNETLGPDCFADGRAGETVNVPGVWEEARPFYDGVGYYRRMFALPAAFQGKILRIKFWAVNYFAEVFVNGTKVGEHEGGYTPFEVDATDAVRDGENELVVRVIDPPRKRRIQGFRSGAPLSQSNIPTWKAGWYFNFGGIWQPVELIATNAVNIQDVFVQPQADLKTVVVDVTLENRGNPLDITLDVSLTPRDSADEQTGMAELKRLRLEKGTTTVSLKGKVDSPHLWSPDDPFLYNAQVKVMARGDQQEAVDSVTTICGLRHFTIEDGIFKLNGQPIAMRGFLQQGVYARHLAFPESIEEARRELSLMKDNGMNFVRAHLKPTPIHLDLCDEMGILVLAEPPIGWIENTPETLDRCTREVRELVLRDRNRPAVIMWGLLNEATHYRTFTAEQLHVFKDALSVTCRSLDPTRIVIDNSGGDIGGKHDGTVNAHMPFGKKTQPLRDLHAYCALPLSVKSLEMYRAHGGGDSMKPDGVRFTKVGADSKGVLRSRSKNEPPVFVSEFGAFENPPDFEAVLGRYSPEDKSRGLEDYIQHKNYYDSLKEQFDKARLADIFGDVKAYIRASQNLQRENIRAVISAMRANPRNSGWVFTQLADASGEIFGATDIWRQPRPWFKDMADVSATPLIVPHVSARVLEPGDAFRLNLRMVNENKTGEDYVWRVRILSGTRTVIKFEGQVKALGWVREIMDEAVEAPKKPGRYVVEAELRDGRRLVSSNYIRFTVIEPADAPCERVAMFDIDNEIRDTLLGLGITHVDKGSNNYRNKDVPCIYAPRPHQHLGLLSEYNRQLRRIIELGGAAIVLEPISPMLFDELTPSLLRLAVPMRNLLFMRPGMIWDGLPDSDGFMDYEFADVLSGRAVARNNMDDLTAMGGTSLAGGFCANMWTGPEVYEAGSVLDVTPVGKGHLIICHFSLQKALTNPVAKRLLSNIIRYAASLIKPGGGERLLSRCIDPVNPE